MLRAAMAPSTAPISICAAQEARQAWSQQGVAELTLQGPGRHACQHSTLHRCLMCDASSPDSMVREELPEASPPPGGPAAAGLAGLPVWLRTYRRACRESLPHRPPAKWREQDSAVHTTKFQQHRNHGSIEEKQVPDQTGRCKMCREHAEQAVSWLSRMDRTMQMISNDIHLLDCILPMRAGTTREQHSQGSNTLLIFCPPVPAGQKRVRVALPPGLLLH